MSREKCRSGRQNRPSKAVSAEAADDHLQGYNYEIAVVEFPLSTEMSFSLDFNTLNDIPKPSPPYVEGYDFFVTEYFPPEPYIKHLHPYFRTRLSSERI